METDRLLKELKDYFAKRDDVVMAFLFGSYSKGRVHNESDIDIAVYIKSESGIEIESGKRYRCENEIWMDVEKIASCEVDLLILNRASSSVCDVAVRTGIPVIIKNRGIYLRYLLAVSDIAEEFRSYIFDVWRLRNATTGR